MQYKKNIENGNVRTLRDTKLRHRTYEKSLAAVS